MGLAEIHRDALISSFSFGVLFVQTHAVARRLRNRFSETKKKNGKIGMDKRGQFELQPKDVRSKYFWHSELDGGLGGYIPSTLSSNLSDQGSELQYER